VKLALKNGKAASDEALRALETALECEISASFKVFVRANDGAAPETNIFKITEENECGVNRFIPVAEILKERACIENVPAKGYPVAWAEGGNYVLIDESRDGAVLFWDHEVPEDLRQVAPSFGAFLDLLEPFDIEKIALKPGQVKKAWIDPEFARRLKK
jgi:hypothetical protein